MVKTHIFRNCHNVFLLQSKRCRNSSSGQDKSTKSVLSNCFRPFAAHCSCMQFQDTYKIIDNMMATAEDNFKPISKASTLKHKLISSPSLLPLLSCLHSPTALISVVSCILTIHINLRKEVYNCCQEAANAHVQRALH